MIIRKTLILALWLPFLAASAQQPVTLEDCLSAAMKNHPLKDQNAAYTRLDELQQKNIGTGKLPQLNLNGQATYQNEVIELPYKIPGIDAPQIPKAQYKVSLDVNQLIYGGGAIDAQSEVEAYSLKINLANNEAELYKIRERVNQLYFGVLLAEMNTGVIRNTEADLKSRLTKAEVAIRGGVLLPSAADVLRAEILKAGQRITEAQAQKQALVSSLSVLTGLPLDRNTSFAEPALEADLTQYTNTRPEFGVFGLMEQKLEATRKLTVSKELPKVYGFGTAGYGNPGYNMFKEGSAPFFTVGAKISWNFWNWNQTSREKQMIDLNTGILENQKNAYDLANRTQVQQYIADIAKAGELLKSDDQIIELRKSVTRSAAAQLENGTLTASDFVSEQLAEEQALLTRNLHRVQLIQAKALYIAATGGL
jgi:outer membrane protein TolC